MGHYFLIGLLAFLCETVDSSLGGEYGTILTPILLLLGYSPLEIVPLILFSEILTGASAAVWHHKKGNVNFHPRGRAAKTTLILSLCGVLGALLAVFLAVTLPKSVVRGYITFLLIVLGMFNFFALSHSFSFSWFKVAILGGLASFNKGLSGGGYGPLVTGGQILSGLDAKNAISITSLAESLTCVVGFCFYLFYNGLGGLNWQLGVPLLLGSVLSVPFAVNLVAFWKEAFLRKAIALTITSLGFAGFIKQFSHLFTLANMPLVFITLLVAVPGAYFWGKRSGLKVHR